MARISRSNARVEITSSASKFGDGLKDARKKLGGFGRDVRGAFKQTTGLIGKIGGGIAAGLGVAGGFGLADVVGDVLDVEKAMTRFQIAGSRTPAQMEAFRASLSRVAKESGTSRAELVAGASQYVALTGDAEGAASAMGLFAKVANATGASMDDIAATAASMRDNLKIDPADFEAAFSALHVQGKAGAVELRELATVMAGVAPMFANFAGGAGAGGLAELGSVLQVVRKEFGSTAEAATGTRALITALTRGSAKLAKLKINVFDEKGQKRNFTTIIDEIMNAGISEPDLQKILGSDEALRAINALKQHRALLGEIRDASKDQNAIERDAAAFRESTAGKLQIAMETLKTSIADAFTPERIQGFVSAVTTVIDGITTLIEKIQGAGEKLGELAAKSVEGPSFWGDVLGGVTGVNPGRMGAAMGLGVNSDGTMTADEARAMSDRADEAWKAQSARLQARFAKERAEAAAKKAAAPVVNVNATLQVDGNAVAAAAANAKGHRRQPGGM